MVARAIRILGIDPGLRRTGWGVVEIEGNRLTFVACGSVETNDRADLATRLVVIHDGLARIVVDYAPDEAAVEATFVNRDAAATLKLGQARGIAMLVPAKLGVRVAEYAPNLVKKTIVGAGHCDKTQIRMMIGVLLPKADPSSEDAADALAIAVTHAHHRQSVILRSGKLKGVIDSYGEDFIIVDVNGVGYVVHCSARTLQALPAAGEPVALAIETHVREDQIRLFGFLTDVEREWFRLLQTVQGVGTKVALAVLGTLKPGDLASAIAMRDKGAVARTPGVGPKVAERIVTELKDKAPAYADVDPAVIRLSGAVEERRAPQPVVDAVSALINLGYGHPQAAAAIAAATRSAGEGADTAQLIRLGLRELAK
jgi:holliday junction DNA helicase RuvA